MGGMRFRKLRIAWSVSKSTLLLSMLAAAGCSGGVTQKAVESRLAQITGWSAIKLDEVDDGVFRGTAISSRGERLNVEIKADERSFEARWKNANGRGEGSMGTTMKSAKPEVRRRRTTGDRLHFWMYAIVVVLVVAAKVAYDWQRKAIPAKERKPSFLLDYDYPLKGWRGVLVALFYVVLMAAILGAAIFASKVHNPNWPDPP
jgi:hypothetical protein